MTRIDSQSEAENNISDQLPNKEDSFAPQKITRRDFLRKSVIAGLGMATVGCGTLDTPAPIPHEAKETAVAATARANTGGGQDFGPLRTSTPTPEPTKQATATPTETAKPVEKSPLPTYGAFLGTFPEGKGNIVIASIPEANSLDQILVYAARKSGPNAQGANLTLYMTKPEESNGTTFQANTGKFTKLNITFDNRSKTLSGRFIYGRPEAPEFDSDFKANYTGTGKKNIINTIKQAKVIAFNMGSVPLDSVRLDELKGMPVDLDKLPE